jgi:hypothetical protein
MSLKFIAEVVISKYCPFLDFVLRSSLPLVRDWNFALSSCPNSPCLAKEVKLFEEKSGRNAIR